jgi:PAS domain S-box-containing protein
LSRPAEESVLVPSSFFQASDDRLRQALDAMPHKVWMVKPDGPALYYNRAMRAFAGAALDLPDRPSREKALLHPDDLERVVAARDVAVAQPEDWSIEARLKCPDGGWRWHRLNFSMLWNKDRVEAWLATATDIDDLHRAIIKARESEDFVRLAAEAAQLGIYSFDLETREHVWSPELKAIAGLAADVPAPTDLLQHIHPDDRERVQSLRRASFDPSGPGTFEDEHRILQPDGSIRWVLVKGRVSFHGEGEARKPKHGVGFVLDITGRKVVEGALRHSEERYRELVENANDIVTTLDLEGRITSVNPAVETILGYKPEELIGLPLSSLVPAEEMKMHESMLRRKLDGEPSTRYEMTVMAKGGQKRLTLDVNSRLISDARGNPIAIHSIARDITERKEAEARQDLLVRELQHRTKNMLAVIQSIATSTLRRSGDLAGAEDALVGRLHALARAQEFVASGPAGGVPLRDLVESELSAFAARLKIEGLPVVLGGAFAQQFALVLHELATNATKYGSLSVATGRVLISWEIKSQCSGPTLGFYWMERDGPPVQPPAKEGFGSQLISIAFNDPPRVSYTENGFEFAVDVPLSQIMGAGSR